MVAGPLPEARSAFCETPPPHVCDLHCADERGLEAAGGIRPLVLLGARQDSEEGDGATAQHALDGFARTGPHPGDGGLDESYIGGPLSNAAGDGSQGDDGGADADEEGAESDGDHDNELQFRLRQEAHAGFVSGDALQEDEALAEAKRVMQGGATQAGAAGPEIRSA